MSPDRKRRAVQVLRERFGCSERRACLLVGQSRTSQRRGPAQITGTERALRARLREISAQHPRWGWRKAHAIARGEGLVTNRKRTRRLSREEGLKRPATARKKRRIGEGRNQRLTAVRPDQMWALDFQTDATVDGRQVRFLNIIDEFTREALATRPFRSCTSDRFEHRRVRPRPVTGPAGHREMCDEARGPYHRPQIERRGPSRSRMGATLHPADLSTRRAKPATEGAHRDARL